MDIKNVHCSKCGAKLGSNKKNITDKFVYYKNGDLKYIDLFHKKCTVNRNWFAKHNLNLLLLGGTYGKKQTQKKEI